MKKNPVNASKKKKAITKPKTVIDLDEDVPIFSAVSNVDLENLNISITANIKDLLVPLIQQIREIRDFLNLRTKCMDPKPNFNNDLTDIICDKDLIVENEIFKVKLEEADKENTFLRGEVKDLTVLLNAKIQTSSHNFKTNSKECLFQENFDTQVQSQFSFQTNSPKDNMLYNQNNFSNKRDSFIPQINSNLTTPATSDPDLKSSVISTYNNSKTLELFNKSSVVDFTIDEILTELGNESEIHNGSILLFPPIEKQEISPSHPNVPFKSSSPFCHEKEQKQRREEICTTKDIVNEFKSVRLISLEDRRLSRSFNDRASHINKTDKSNNNAPASYNHSSPETTDTAVEQKINVSENSSGNNANFSHRLMSVNNVYNVDAHPWPKNTILVAGDSIINGINEKRISTNFKSVKVRCFSGATIDDMYFNLIPLLRKKPVALVLHVGTNNSSNETPFQIYDKLLNLVHFIKENNPNCHAVLSSSIDRLDGKAALTIKRINSLLSESSLDINDNSNIGHSFLGIHGLHLNGRGVGKLALNFVKRIRSILNSGSAKQKLKEVHSRISSF